MQKVIGSGQKKMRKFDYRVPRFPVDLPVQVRMQGTTWMGRCKEISTEGLSLETQRPFPIEACAAIQVTYRSTTLDILVRGVHSGAGCEGLRFVFESDEQREEVTRFVGLLANASPRMGPVLLH